MLAAVIPAAFIYGERGKRRHGEEVVISEGPGSSLVSDCFATFLVFFFEGLEDDDMERDCLGRHVRRDNVFKAEVGMVILLHVFQ